MPTASPPPPSRLRAALDPACWSWGAARLALFAPGLLALGLRVLAPLLPDEFVWVHAAKALLLVAPRWCLALWGPAALLLAARARALAPAALVLGVFGLASAGRPLSDAPGEGYRIVTSNVNTYGENPTPGATEHALAALDADVVVALERRPEQIPGLRRVADDFEDDMPRPSHASAVFCREGVACEAAVTEQIGSETMKMPVALVRLGGELCLLGVHAPPPAPYDPSGIGPYIQEIARHLAAGRLSLDWGPCRAGDPALVSGDLNAVPLSTAWRTLDRCCGLSAPLLAHGVFASSWPAGGGWPNLPVFPIDHVFAGAVEVSGLRLARVPGTDHKAVMMRARPAPTPVR